MQRLEFSTRSSHFWFEFRSPRTNPCICLWISHQTTSIFSLLPHIFFLLFSSLASLNNFLILSYLNPLFLSLSIWLLYLISPIPVVFHKALFKYASNSADSHNVNRLLIDNLSIAFPYILDLLNPSLNSPSFSSPWKLFCYSSSENKESLSDFCSISLLYHFFKILE